MEYSDSKLLDYVCSANSIKYIDVTNTSFIEFYNIVDFREFIIKEIILNLSIEESRCFYYNSCNWKKIQNSMLYINSEMIFISFREQLCQDLSINNLKIYIWEENILRLSNLISQNSSYNVIIKKNEISNLSEIYIGDVLIKIRNVKDVDSLMQFYFFDQFMDNFFSNDYLTWKLDIKASEDFLRCLPIRYTYNGGYIPVNLTIVNNYDNTISFKITDIFDLQNTGKDFIAEHAQVDEIDDNVFLMSFDAKYSTESLSLLKIFHKCKFPIEFKHEQQSSKLEQISLQSKKGEIVDFIFLPNDVVKRLTEISNKKDYNWRNKYNILIPYIESNLGYINYYIINLRQERNT